MTPFGKELGWFAKRGYRIPNYDVPAVRKRTIDSPRWLHFGAGNIFRAFIAQLAEALLNAGVTDSGLIAVEGFDYDVVDLVYRPYDHFSVVVEIKADGSIEKSLVCSVADALKADPAFVEDWARLRSIFTNSALELVSFTVTEKAYVINEQVRRDCEQGPLSPTVFLTKLASLLLERFKCGLPLTIMSFDNFNKNSVQLKNGLLEIANIWIKRGYVASGFVDYIENALEHPITVIDKIVPAPAREVQAILEEDGLDFSSYTTEKGTKIAAFVNAEYYQYLVVENRGRAEVLDHPEVLRNVYVTSKEEVERFEKMKVSACLNPVHTATAIFGVLLGHTHMHEAISDPLVKRLAYGVAQEAMTVVESPSFVNPKAFLEEVIEKRIANPYVPDSPFRIATDTSQKFPVRFGPTLRRYCSESNMCDRLRYVPLVIAGWLRYLLGVDDNGEPYVPSPDPELQRLRTMFETVQLGRRDETVRGMISRAIEEILSDERIFGVDLSSSPISGLVESLLISMLASTGAVRRTLESYLSGV